MTKLSIAWEFKMQCENSDAKLRQICSNSENLQVPSDLDSFLALKEEHSIYSENTAYNESLNFSEFPVKYNDSVVRANTSILCYFYCTFNFVEEWSSGEQQFNNQ